MWRFAIVAGETELHNGTFARESTIMQLAAVKNLYIRHSGKKAVLRSRYHCVYYSNSHYITPFWYNVPLIRQGAKGTAMDSFLDDIFSTPLQPEDPIEKRRASFRHINASFALEGLIADKAELALQEEVIQGRLTTKQAIAQLVEKYSELPSR
jgi:hypothetical protein